MTFRDTTEIEKIREAYHRCDEPGEVLIAKAYAAGLRRAQELAKELFSFDDSSHVPGRLGEGRPNWTDFDQALDAEVAKERT